MSVGRPAKKKRSRRLGEADARYLGITLDLEQDFFWGCARVGMTEESFRCGNYFRGDYFT